MFNPERGMSLKHIEGRCFGKELKSSEPRNISLFS